MLKLEPGMSNPWLSKTLDDFLYYMCPECFFKTQDGNEFMNHCQDHPLAQDFVNEVYYSQPQEEEEDDNFDPTPTEFVDCNIELEQEDEKVPVYPQQPQVVVQQLPKNNFKSIKWNNEIEDAWNQFQAFINYSNNYGSKDIVNFLVENYKTKNMAPSSVLHLKTRINIAYKEKTGRTLHEDFPEVNEYCRQLGFKTNSARQYQKKKLKSWEEFNKFTKFKGLDFTEADLKRFAVKLKREKKYTKSSMKNVFIGIKWYYQKETEYKWEHSFPNIGAYIDSL